MMVDPLMVQQQQNEAATFRSRAISSTVATLGGFGASQVLRLISNIVLSRLLFPHAFGLMAVVALFMQGLTMFSDVGITPAIVQHREEASDSFLNTAWTIQIVRGVALWLCLCVLAYPIALLYGEPELSLVLPVAGLNAVIIGLGSTALASERRNLMLGRQTVFELLGQVVTIAVMVVWALVDPSVWALAVGGLAGTTVMVILSHVALPGIRHRLAWDAQARRELFKFGRWITVSTAFTFVASQGDRAILSAFVSMTTLGIYSVAANLSQAILNAFGRLSMFVLLPVYSAWGREGPDKLRQQLYRVRMKTQWWVLFPPCVLVVLGDPLVRLLYDSRYDEAGWMLPLMGIAVVLQTLTSMVEPVLLATGDSYRHMLLTISRGVLILLTSLTGAFLDGIRGLLLGVVVGRALQYPLLVLAVRSKGAWMPWVDLAAVLFSTGVIASGMLILRLVGALS